MTATDSPAKNYRSLLHFSYGEEGSESELLLVSGNEDLSLPNGVWYSDPKLEVRLPKNSVGFPSSEAKVRVSSALPNLPLVFPPFVEGHATPVARASILEWVTTERKDSLRLCYRGLLQRTRNRPGGKDGIVELEFASDKDLTEQRAGTQVLRTCIWTLGDAKTCGVDLGPLRQTGSLTSIDRNVVTVTGLTDITSNYWQEGYLEYGGVRIKIRGHAGTSFNLSSIPPVSWIETVNPPRSTPIDVVVTPGCLKTPSVCSFPYNNLEQIRCDGISLREYNPQFENPDEAP